MADAQRIGQINRVLWQILLLNILVASSKIVVGIVTGTVALIADGLHSTTDGASNVVGIVAYRIAKQPPDKEHPYGHERFESLATLAIGGMLLLAGWEVFQMAIDRLLSGDAAEVGIVQFAVLIGTLVINFGVAWYEKRAAHRLESPLLQADSQHTASDVWVTLSVIGGLIAVRLGLEWVDAVIALFIVGLILRIAWKILQKTSMVLVDAAPISADELEKVTDTTPGVQKTLRARSRGSEQSVHVDLDVAVLPTTSAGIAAAIADNIRARMQTTFPHIQEVRIQISTDSEESSKDYLGQARRIAEALGLNVHELVGIATTEGKILEMHVEVTGGTTLLAAHQQIDELEALLLEIPDVVRVLTHIEPAVRDTVHTTKPPEAEQITAQAAVELAQQFAHAHWHELAARHEHGGYVLTAHCYLPPDMQIEDAHRLAEDAEVYLRAKISQLNRVIIHTEPEGVD